MHPRPSVHLRSHGLDQREDLPLLGLRRTRRCAVSGSVRGLCRPGAVGSIAGISPRQRSGARHFRGRDGANLVELSNGAAEHRSPVFTQLSKIDGAPLAHVARCFTQLSKMADHASPIVGVEPFTILLSSRFPWLVSRSASFPSSRLPRPSSAISLLFHRPVERRSCAS